MNKIEELRREADMRELVEGTELQWWECVRQGGHVARKPIWGDIFTCEFAVAIVEGRPVFWGDMLWDSSVECKYTVHCGSTEYLKNNMQFLSWEKPKTVTVELTREDAEGWNTLGGFCLTPETKVDYMTLRFYEAIEKALK